MLSLLPKTFACLSWLIWFRADTLYCWSACTCASRRRFFTSRLSSFLASIAAAGCSPAAAALALASAKSTSDWGVGAPSLSTAEFFFVNPRGLKEEAD